MTDLIKRLNVMREFLGGSGPLDGYWFGDVNPDQRGAFWWRHNLSVMAEAADQLADAQAAQAMVVERCAEEADRRYAAGEMGNPGHHILALAPIDGLALVRELRDRAEKAEARLDRHLSIFADHAAVVWGIIRAAGDLPTLNDGPFKEGFISGMEEVAARGDIQAADGNHQLQDLCEQIIALVTGEATLIMAKPEVVVRKMAAEADRDTLAAANAVLEAKVAGLVEALKPFDAVGGTLFSKNWNANDIVFDGGPMRSDCLFFEDFLNLRAALATQEAGNAR